MVWPKMDILVNGKIESAIAPYVISASRATDIPAFYSKQFMGALKKGFLYWTNPFNNKKSLISFKNTKVIVFWTKNPAPLMPYLTEIDALGIDYYFTYTLNDYEKEGLEPNLPSLQKRINTFIELSEKTGKDKVIWRFDPVIVLEKQSIDEVVDKIGNIAVALKNHTNKLVFSFIDTSYRKVQNKLKKEDFKLLNIEKCSKEKFVEKLTTRLADCHLEIATCAEESDFTNLGVGTNKCIDDELIRKVFFQNKKLISFIQEVKAKNQLKDRGQRTYCQCMVSKDIGRYNTCGFSCIYCYAMQKSSPNQSKNIFD